MPGRVCFVTLFPEYFETAMGCSVIGRAVSGGLVSYDVVCIRDYGIGGYRRVDDAPYGGGAGQVMKPEPVVAAIEAARGLCGDAAHVVLMSPQGRVFRQEDARRLAGLGCPLVFVCGHYEGVDERVRGYVDEEISIGDFVLTGGELGALVVSDAVCRLWPGVLGNGESAVDESFSAGWLEYPQYTRPVEFRGERVPDVLLGGDHGAVARWRFCESVNRTRSRRPDIFAALEGSLSFEERVILGWEEPPRKRRRNRGAGKISVDNVRE